MLRRNTGFTILEVMIVIAIIGVLSALVIPRMVRANHQVHQKACIGNLIQIERAIQQWALEAKVLPTDVVKHKNLVPYLKNQPVCPLVKGGSFLSDYGMTFVKEAPFCVNNVFLADSPHILSSQVTTISKR